MEEIFLVFLQALFEIFGEFLIQLLFQLGIELIQRRIAARDDSAVSVHESSALRLPFRLGAYGAIGAAIGALSLLVFPDPLIHSMGWRVTNLMAGPALLGGFMAYRGRRLASRGVARADIDSFWPAFVFAFTLNGVRLYFAR